MDDNDQMEMEIGDEEEMTNGKVLDNDEKKVSIFYREYKWLKKHFQTVNIKNQINNINF